MHNTLESHKFFPYIAWATVIGFAFFTYNLAMNVQAELDDIGSGVERLEQKLMEMEAKTATSSKKQ